MPHDASHIRHIRVVSNTHWDREFRRSFEKTRRRLLDMLDTTLDILERDARFHSFTMDGHCIMMDDYVEMRPERRAQIERLVREGRLILGPWYTLPETMSVTGEAIVRNFLRGRERVAAWGGKPNTVAYTPASWGQTGQLPQILDGFGIRRMMFYRGISHHESEAEFLWSAPDGTTLTCSRFAIYARYNWYYQVHRAVSRGGRTFSKDYRWGEFDEAPFRFADGLAGEDLAFDLKSPAVAYDRTHLVRAIEEMVGREGSHFTTPVFLAMNGHDISVAWPLEAQVIEDAREDLAGRYTIEHTDLEAYWEELENHLDKGKIAHLHGERRAHLQKGMWTYLLPASISARTYLKVQDFAASTALAATAEPLASLAASLGAPYPTAYLRRGWDYLMSNHTHDANGGCAPDAVCLDVEYRYRKASDIADIVTEDAMAWIARNLDPAGQPADAVQVVVYNPLPFERDAVALVDLEVPRGLSAKSVRLESPADTVTNCQPVSWEKSSSFVDGPWDVPTILESDRLRFHARFRKLPGLGYRAYRVVADPHELRSPATMVTGPAAMENEFVSVAVNSNGTVTLVNKATGMVYEEVNYLSDQGECGNAWKHVAPVHDRVYTTLGVSARVAVTESGPLVSRIAAEFDFVVPRDYADGTARSELTVALPVRVEYTVEAGSPLLKVRLTVDNQAKDHWLRACFPTGLAVAESVADSHFDVVRRPVAVPDSTGWVEKYEPTHPLRTFVGLSDGRDGMAVFTKGLFEYEARDDEQRTLLISLVRACRIKLAVSEEKQTELPDQGVQCPGVHSFDYAVCVHEGDWDAANLPRLASEYATPVRIAETGRGKGNLPLRAGLFQIAAGPLQVTCVKQAEAGSGLIVRLFNPSDTPKMADLSFGLPVNSAVFVRLDETELGRLNPVGNRLVFEVGAKKIISLKTELA